MLQVVEFKQLFDQAYANKWDQFQKFAQKVQNMINYQFSNNEYLYEALSIRGSRLPKDKFERLEFLGDALLRAVQGILLFEKYSEFKPGELSLLRSNLERNKNLALLAKELPFNDLSMMLEIGQISDNQAAECLEALIGAIYLDNGKNFDLLLDVSRRITHFEKSLKQFKESPEGAKDPKSVLHEKLQKHYKADCKIDYPAENRGKPNAPEFFVHVIIKRITTGKIEMEGEEAGPFTNKKDAEKDAARKLLLKLDADEKFGK